MAMKIEMLQFTIIFITHPRYCVVILLNKSYLSLNADFPNFQRNNQVTQGFWFSPTDTNCPSSHESRLLEPKLRWVSQRNPHLIVVKNQPLSIMSSNVKSFCPFLVLFILNWTDLQNFDKMRGFIMFLKNLLEDIGTIKNLTSCVINNLFSL